MTVDSRRCSSVVVRRFERCCCKQQGAGNLNVSYLRHYYLVQLPPKLEKNLTYLYLHLNAVEVRTITRRAVHLYSFKCQHVVHPVKGEVMR